MTPEERDQFYRELYEKTEELRIRTLFEEPCPLYEDDDELH